MQGPKVSFCRRMEPENIVEIQGKWDQVSIFCPYPPEKPEIIAMEWNSLLVVVLLLPRSTIFGRKREGENEEFVLCGRVWIHLHTPAGSQYCRIRWARVTFILSTDIQDMSHWPSRKTNFSLRTKPVWIPSRHRKLTALHSPLCYQCIEECLSLPLQILRGLCLTVKQTEWFISLGT